MKRTTAVIIALLAWTGSIVAADADMRRGYYSQPALSGDTLVFVAEGDLWRVPATGGAATRLTTHAATESQPAISPDGTTVAFVASYEGETELYTMPLAGGQPHRRTWSGSRINVASWTPAGQLLVATNQFATLPDLQLVELDPVTGSERRIPLAQASDGCTDESGDTLFFTRYAMQGSRTKRYTGGTAQRLWRFDAGADEALPLTADYPGTSRDPMWWRGRLYFASDRDGTMNLWSMRGDGSGLEQHTHHVGWDLLSPSLSEGRVAYQLGADLRILDLATGRDEVVPIELVSDFDQTREHWVADPIEYLSSVHIAPDGERVVLTARGLAFVAPRKKEHGRLVQATHAGGVRHRDVRFMPDGRQLLSLSDASGEVELWTLPANGVGDPQQLSSGAEVLRWQAIPSPDGKMIAHHDKNNRLWLHDVEHGSDTQIASSGEGSFSDLSWSPDSAWLAYAVPARNTYRQIHLYRVSDGLHVLATSERYDSYSPGFTADGKWLALLSDRHLESVVRAPWGTLQPEPFFDKRSELFLLALQPGLRSPFAPDDELVAATKEDKKDDAENHDGDAKKKEQPVAVEIAVEGLQERLVVAPVPAANSSDLAVGDGVLFWLEREAGSRTASLRAIKLDNIEPEVVTVVEGINSFELSSDASKILIRKAKEIHVIDAAADKSTLDEKTRVDLSQWSLSVVPRVEWRQMFVEAWRLERDYFYDANMHGVDWDGVLARYLPLVDRVRCRADLSNLLAQMVSELCAIHTFVYGGDDREGDDDITIGRLGAVLTRDESAGGDRVAHIYRFDPDQPQRRSPLAAPGVDVHEGDVITHVDGVPVLTAPSSATLLRTKVGQQTLLRVIPADGKAARDVIVSPISPSTDFDLRYLEWELTRRERVEELGGGEIGYVHLRAMGPDDIAQWARNFYPVFHRQGLIVDVRHNRGGNIESWIIEKLMRKAWGAWSERSARPFTNMQYAFRGHLVVLCDAWTASDGEAFLEAIRRLELGPIIGTRTWGGGIWLTSSNVLVDGGIATAAEFGLFGPEGQWIIEMDGVSPDIEVDNLPHATFLGGDAQLDAAIELLKTRIAEAPVEPLQPPPGKDLSLKP